MPLPMLRSSIRSNALDRLSLRGGPNHQCRFKDDGSSARHLFGLDQAEHKLGSALANHLAVLIDARQRNPKTVIIGQISAADESNIFRNPEACFEDGAHGSDRKWIVEAENAVGPLVSFQEEAHGLRTLTGSFVIHVASTNYVVF